MAYADFRFAVFTCTPDAEKGASSILKRNFNFDECLETILETEDKKRRKILSSRSKFYNQSHDHMPESLATSKLLALREKNATERNRNKFELAASLSQNHIHRDSATSLYIRQRSDSETHFSLYDDLGSRTFVYVVHEDVVPEQRWRTMGYSTNAYVELLKSEESYEKNGIKRTFFLTDNLSGDGSSLIIITVEREQVLVNFALFDGEEVHVLTKPRIVSFFDAPLLYLPCSGRDHECPFESSIDSNTIIIDTLAMKPVLRTTAYNQENKSWNSEVYIAPNRTYVAFQIRVNQTKYDIATALLTGHNGFSKDTIRAAALFEEEGTAKSLLSLAHIFMNEPDYHDESIAVEYLLKAADAGSDLAALELAIYFWKSLHKESRIQRILEAASRAGSAPASFLRAVFLEFEHEPDAELIYMLYWSAANQGYLPAKLRLSKWKHVGIIDDNVWESFKLSMDAQDGEAEFCFGGMLLFGWGISPQSELGLEYLQRAVEKGHQAAAKDLYLYYIENLVDYVDSDSFEKCTLTMIADSTDASYLIKQANILLDLEPSRDKADILAVKMLEKAIELDNSYATAINNLGWVYKNGRGHKQDYQKAAQLFEDADLKGSANALYHLGEMHEQGLGMQISREKALEYYQRGAELGNKKAAKSAERLIREIAESPSLDRLSYIVKKVDDIQRTVDKVDAATGSISDDVRHIRSMMTSVSDYVLEQKRILSDRQANGELSDAQVEAIRGDFVDQTATEIAGRIYKDTSAVDMEEATLRRMFGNHWEKLEPYTQKVLVSARVFLSNCGEYSNLDFSGVVILCVSGLEKELKRFFFDKYQEHLIKLHGDNYYNWPRSMKWRNKDGTYTLNKVFTIGSLTEIFGSNTCLYKNEQQSLDKYLKTILDDNTADSRLFTESTNGLSFLDRCEEIRVLYRNPAAHTEPMTRDSAEACFKVVVGPQEAAQGVACIQGLIYDLIKLMK